MLCVYLKRFFLGSCFFRRKPFKLVSIISRIGRPIHLCFVCLLSFEVEIETSCSVCVCMFREKIRREKYPSCALLTLCPAICVGEIGFPDSANRRGGNCRDDRNDGCLGHARGSCFSVPGPIPAYFFFFPFLSSVLFACVMSSKANRRRKMSFFLSFCNLDLVVLLSG